MLVKKITTKEMLKAIEDLLLKSMDFGDFRLPLTQSMQTYIAYYDLPSLLQATYYCGFIPFMKTKLWGMLLTLKGIGNPTEVVVIVHGYQSHIGDQKNLIWRHLLDGKMVAIYDLPGHGLSGGECVKDFSEYVKSLETFLVRINTRTPSKKTFFCHSQGFAIVAKYARSKKFINIVALAPMERLGNWLFVLIVAYLWPFEMITGAKANVSSDNAYNEFAKEDPLQSKSISISWLKAVIKAHREFSSFELYDSTVRLKIIQGNRDKIVDWRFNIISIATKFQNIDISIIDGADHQLQNEQEDILQRVLEF